MSIGMHTSVAQWGRRIVAVGAVALLLAGAAVAPAAARPKGPGPVAASIIVTCLNSDGSPYYFEYLGVWSVGCDYHDGQDPVVLSKGDD